MKVIECAGLTKTYGNVRALNNLSVSIEENKITGLIGRNGAGKTTFLKIVAGFLHQTDGEIKVFAQVPFNNIKVSANTILIDDSMTFPSSFTIKDILSSFGSFYEKFDPELATDLLDYFNINPRQYPDHLSKGMRSTFLSVIGIAVRSPLTLFDEPTIGMDAVVRKDFYRALLKDYMTHPRTIIISSHYLKEIEDLIEDVLLIKDGMNFRHLPITDLAEMTIGLKGNSARVEELAKGKEQFYQEKMGKDTIYLVTKNDFDEGDLRQARMQGIEISSVTAEEIYVYLTGKDKGGIDHVLDRD
ncbi:ABC transporter ATP-binding protein [Dehalobacterium formicoaceticum]|uniref:ABC transporter ATP-binding protein n=1 Tax=Dehalobacterium formicoaceticum TaxID=51515 RepID=A0ABT1Y463_9FIRM|nr:ABC transporter ATP-binding protein [Dehalobacterium formicoaceticum]